MANLLARHWRGFVAGTALSASVAAAAPHSGPAVPAPAFGRIQPPLVALRPNGVPGGGARSLGVLPPHGFLAAATNVDPSVSLPPASVDLSQWNPPVGDQGQLPDCVSWATGYYLRGWYAARDGYLPSGGFAPTSLYGQIVGGSERGTTLEENMGVLQSQGIVPASLYPQGPGNYWQPPDGPERAAAAPYRISGYTPLFEGQGQGSAAQTAIEAALASGDPVALIIPVDSAFEHASAAMPLISTLGQTLGYHGVFASKYDQNGLWIENQWGTNWGVNGWIELSWSWINAYAAEAMTMQPQSPLPSAAPSATAVPATPTITPTLAAPTATATSIP